MKQEEYNKTDDIRMDTVNTLTSSFLRDLYARMLLTRIVDDCACRLHQQGRITFVASCRGHEAAQVGSALCIEVGKDFTLPYYRDLGVVLTVGMTPYEVLRTYLHMPSSSSPTGLSSTKKQPVLHWGYHKHNTVTGPAPVATQLLHAAGIAFASKLRKAGVVTVAYCGDGATSEPDFQEGLHFAAQHQLPVIFICEQNCTQINTAHNLTSSCLKNIPLPPDLTHIRIDGTDVLTVYKTMHTTMEQARAGQGPFLLEMSIRRAPSTDTAQDQYSDACTDPLLRYQSYLAEHGLWDQSWADQLTLHLRSEVERALQDALQDTV